MVPMVDRQPTLPVSLLMENTNSQGKKPRFTIGACQVSAWRSICIKVAAFSNIYFSPQFIIAVFVGQVAQGTFFIFF